MILAHLDYLNRGNLDYIESLFQQYRENPNQTPPEWKMFFNGVELAKGLSSDTLSEKELAVFQLISAYRSDGHLYANLDPLQLKPSDKSKKWLPFFSRFDLDEKDLNKKFQISSILGMKPGESLENIIHFMEKAYCGTISLQVGGCQPEIREWFFNELEGRGDLLPLSKDQKKNIFYELARTEALESFLHSRFVGAKRFSIEGGDALIPMLEYLAEKGVKTEVKELVIGMAHRGRLNVLNNFMNQATEIVFMEFDGGKALQHFDFDGDVKYHMGYSSVKTFFDKSSCNILLAYNPSHLEAVNSVVCGIARARQRALKDQKKRKAVLPLLIHGDAAFSGQGSVSETLQLSELEGFTTGGVLHIILNNQVGFTTDPVDARSSVHASDLAKAIQAPVLLVNADDLNACIRAVDIALRFRQKFGKDVFIDLICYRRFGHNEGDEPAFTQPLMYQKIKNHPTARQIYSKELEKENLLGEKEGQKFYDQQIQTLQSILDKTRKNNKVITREELKGTLWEQHKKPSEEDFFKEVDTCPLDKHLDKTLNVLTQVPDHFHLHPKVKKLIQSRQKKVKEDQLDWALCELAAYGTLCLENHPVRISGQDSKRGTFSHRHAVYFDIKTGTAYSPLSLLNPDKGEFCIYNSPLSEMAVLGFEYGNACADHSYFTLWEAQFGDFANGAQIIIDQFISSGEEKWMQNCGLVLLLPHGYEGQGPEHSSARLERFLQLCAQGNIQVCYPTTPANFFHLLRRQVKRDFRTPLIVMTPKSLLRHPEVISSRKDLIRSSGFQEVIADPQVKKPKNVEVLILCSGKVYFDLKKEREQSSSEDLSHTALVRVEQLYPFPKLALTPFLNGYHRLKKVLWVQEEPANMGAASYIIPRLHSFMNTLGLENTPLTCLSRKEKASPATGSPQIHKAEYEELIKSLFIHARV